MRTRAAAPSFKVLALAAVIVPENEQIKTKVRTKYSFLQFYIWLIYSHFSIFRAFFFSIFTFMFLDFVIPTKRIFSEGKHMGFFC